MASPAGRLGMRHIHGDGPGEPEQMVRRGRQAQPDLLRDERQGDRGTRRAQVLRLRRGQIRGFTFFTLFF